MESDTELINSCRVCRASNQDGEFESLFITEDSGTWLSPYGILYEELLNVEIETSKRLYYPRYLCNSCELQMKLFKKLKTRATKTLEMLREAENVKKQPSRLMQKDQLWCEPDALPTITQVATTIATYDKRLFNHSTSLLQMEQFEALDEAAGAKQSEEALTLIDERPSEIYHDIVSSATKPVDIYEDSCSDIDEIELAGARVVRVEEEQTEDSCSDIGEIELAEAQVEKLEEDEEQNSVLYMTETYVIVNDLNVSDEDSGNDIKQTQSSNKSETSGELEFETEGDNSTASTTDNIDFLDVNYLDELSEECRSRADTIQVTKRNSENTLKCFLCAMEFSERLEFVAHRKVMHDSKYPCPECPKLFRTSDALRVHSKLHGGEAPYKCELCHKTFNQKVHYRYHMDRHNNVRNFKCEQCGKAFISKADLSVHARIHAGDRRYACEICGKDFLMLQHLKMHQYSHSKKSFECEICKQKFVSPTTLRTHMLTIHEKTPQFECEICVKRFRRKHHLMAHYKVHSKPKADRCRLKQQKAIFEFMEIMEAEQMEEISVVDDEQSQAYNEHLQQNSSNFSL